MSRARRPLHVAGLLGASLLIASGCGGGADVPPVDPNAGAGAVPGATTPGTVAADPNAAIDPATGAPIEGGAVDAGVTATVPDLVGDDVGGLTPLSGDSPLFTAGAVDPEDLADEPDADADKGDAATTTDTVAKPAVTFSGATIYVDGITHTVNKNGTFPKGNPVFRLLAVNADDIEIALVAGEFTSSGGDGTFLDKGDMVSLVNASEQVTYRVKYLRPIKSTTDIAL